MCYYASLLSQSYALMIIEPVQNNSLNELVTTFVTRTIDKNAAPIVKCFGVCLFFFPLYASVDRNGVVNCPSTVTSVEGTVTNKEYQKQTHQFLLSPCKKNKYKK